MKYRKSASNASWTKLRLVAGCDRALTDIEREHTNGVVYAGEDAARVYPNPRPAGSMYFRPRDGGHPSEHGPGARG